MNQSGERLRGGGTVGIGAGMAAGLLCAAVALTPTVAAAAKAKSGGTGRDALAGSSQPTPNATIKLIEILIQNGVLTRAQANALLKQAEEEAAAQSRAAPTAGAAVAPVPGQAAGQAPGVIAAPDVPPGTVRVPYVPETVKKQIKEQVKAEVVQQAKDEGWAQPDALPDWTKRIRPSGDIRLRFEQDFLDNDNDPNIANFNSINQSNGLDVNPNNLVSVPTINTTEDRTRYRLRARLGLDAEIDDWVDASFRIATGNDNSPVSTNQTLGDDGNLSKYNIWLDQAYLQFTPADWSTATVGRMPNPFWTTDLLFDTDLNFDGLSAQFDYPVYKDTEVFLTAGGFPVFNTDFNFPSTSSDKVQSRDKYLLALQAGLAHKIDKDFSVKGAVGFFDFENLNGKSSDPCLIVDSDSTCDTDETRPQFSQKGSTMFGIRQFVPSANPNAPEYQYFGYASKFGVLDVYSRLDVATYDPIHVSLEADYLKNLLFDHSEINGKNPVNNLNGGNDWEGGDTGFLVRATVGNQDIDELWKWNVSLAYKYLESDAVPDAFTDSDFHLGGTNAQGFILGGSLGIARDTFLSLRWLSAEEVSGPPLSFDVFQLDLNASF